MEPTTSARTAREELARVIVGAYGEDADTECPCVQDLQIADAILAAGYRKPRTICYVILDGDASPQARYATKDEAVRVRDEWIAAHESAGVPHKFRVAEIVESA